MAVSPALLKGYQILRVGERSAKDKKFATDEFLAAPPGTIVAPRPKGTAPTMQNAIKALAETASKALPQPPRFDSTQALKGAQEGAYTIVSGDTLSAIAQQMAPHLPIYGTGGSLELLLAANPQFASDPGSIFPGQQVTNPWFTAPATPSTPATKAAAKPPTQPIQPILADEVGRLGIPTLNASIMQSLGFIAPSLTGITDPAKFREGLQGLQLSERPTTEAGQAATAGGTGVIPTQAASSAFPASSLIRELLAPTSQLSLSSTNTPTGAIPTLASRFTGADRILKALGGPLSGGRVASVGAL